MPPASTTRDQLLDTAQDLIQKRGVNGFSFQDLGESVGIRKASIHHHFATKADLIESLTGRYLLAFQELTEEILTSDVSGKTKLRRYCDLFLETLQSGKNDKSCLCGMLMAEVASADKPVREQIQRFLRDNLDVLEAILKQGSHDGSLSQTRGARATALLVLSALEGGLMIARSDQGPKQFAGLVSRLIAMLAP